MKHLHAPWRLEYILGEEPEGCFFCEGVDVDPCDWMDLLVLYKSDTMLVMLNRYPYNGGHLLIAPNRHTCAYGLLTDEELTEMSHATRLCVRALETTMFPEGFNIGMNLGKCSGAGVESHLHMHVVPRWSGDTNFLPVFNDTRSIPVALEELWKQLKPVFDGLKEEKNDEEKP